MSKYEFDGEKVKKLYGAMQKLGYQQSLGEFEKGFYGRDNYQKRKAVYDAMTEAGADLGSSYEDFMGRMRATSSSGGASKSANKAAETKTFEMPWEKKSKEAKRADAILHGGGGAFLRGQEVSADEDFRKLFPNKLASERVEDPKSKRLITKPKKYRVPESEAYEDGNILRMVDAYKTVDGRAVPISSGITVPKSDEDDDFATEYIAGKIDRKEYKKKAKAKDNEAAIDNSQPTMESDEEFLYRTDKRYREYRDKILNGDGDIDELSPETKAWYLQRVEAKIKDAEERQKKYLSIINSDEHQKKLEENNTDFWRNFGQARGGLGAVGRDQAKAMLRETDYSDEMNLANAGLGATESELTDLHALRDMLKGKDVGFFRRFKDFFGNRNNLTFGYQDFIDNSALIANKNSKSPLLSSAAESKAKADEAATMYSRSANLRAKGGDVSGQMVPFIVEIVSAGDMSSVAGRAAHKGVYSLGSRVLKSAALKGMQDGLLKATGTTALKIGTRGLSWVASSVAAGAVVTVTTGAGETAANITRRKLGQGAKQEDGSFAFEGGEDTVGAVLHGFTSQLVENATEFMGGGLGYGVGKVASKLTKPLAKVGLGGVTNFFARIAASPISKATSRTLSKFQIQGIPEEIGEEYLGWAGHSMAGDGDAEWSDFADFQKHKELWVTMALSVGAMGALPGAGHGVLLIKSRRNLRRADRAAAGIFTDESKWGALRDKLDGASNETILRTLYDNVMQDKSLNGRERRAAMLYAGNLLAYRGANLGAIAGRRLVLERKRLEAEDARRAAMVEGAEAEGAESVDEHELDGDDVVSSAFRQGYEETSAANAYLWAKELEAQEKRAQRELGFTEQELNEKFSSQNSGRTLNEMREALEGTYTEKQKKAAFDYANTRAVYEGVVERTKDDIEDEIAYRHAIVDRQVHVNDGTLRPVALFTSEKNKTEDAFLVSGELGFEQNANGETIVSDSKSDPTLIISDAAGRTRMISPSEIADAGFPIDVDEYKNTLAEHVRQELEERKYAEMMKAAEEANAQLPVDEEQESQDETVSTSEEAAQVPSSAEEVREENNVFRGEFNVGDKFTTEEGTFEVVQLTEGEAPIVQNVETGQQFRPHSEDDLRAAVQSYTPTFIDGAENTNGVTTYNRVAQEEFEPQNEAQEDSRQGQEEVAPKPNEAQREEETTSENESVDEEQEVAPEGRGAQETETQQGRHLSEKEARRLLSAMEGQIDNDTFMPDVVVNVDGVLHLIKLIGQGGVAISYIVSAEPGRRSQVAGMRDRTSVGFFNEEGRQLVLDMLSKYPIVQIDRRLSGFEASEGETEDSQQEEETESSSEAANNEVAETEGTEEKNEDDAEEASAAVSSSHEEVQSALDKGEIEGITPQMAHDALYNDPDLEAEEVDAIVENSRSTAQANLAKLQKTEIKPRKNESVIAFKKRKAAHIADLARAEELVRFWEAVQEARRNIGAQAMQKEEQAKQQREAEAAERAKEQAENGLAVAPSWANAEKIVGRPGEFITPNGLRVKGHYVLVESGAAVPSHDARHGFKQSEGFPTDEKGHTLNDRDYERDLDAQRVQREIARNYDARATQQPVVVSPEGFVLSGNGRTMSGDLAAMENTDGAYNNYVREYAEMWGFTSDQVEKLEHPRVVFVSDNPLPLTTETFAAFNAQETKTQSRTEKAVKMGKAVSDEDFAKILRIVTDGHETLSDFYSNANAAAEALNVLETSGVITQQDRANLFDGDVLSDEGRNLLENVLLGKAFEGNPDVVRQLSEVRSLRTSVLNALFYIVENERLNEEFRLSNELSRAINFVYHARKGGGYSFGDKVRTFVQQTELFESTTDVSLEDATVLLLADALNDKRTTLVKSIFKSYNERAEDAGKGQMSLFGDAIPSRETLIMETLALLDVDIKDYAPSNQVEPSNQATNEQQQEPKQQQQPEAGTSESTSEQGAEGKTETELPSGSVSTSERGNEGVSTEEEGAKTSDKNAKPSEKSAENGRIREQRVGTSDIVVGQTVYFRNMPMPWKVEAISPDGKLTITTEISGHVLRHENVLQRWVSLSPVEKKQSDKELSHANNTVSEEQGDTKSARESDSEALNSIESRDKDYADAVARGDIETAERMLAEEAERKGYSLDSPYQGESAFNGKAPSDSGYYENAEERKKAYDEGDYEGDWTLADELVHGVDMGSLVDFRLSDNELRRANDMTRESILNLREALRRARSGEKNITIKMYRSVPPGVKEREFRNGDWITPSRLYALDNAEIHEGYEGENQEGWNGGYRIIEQEVPIEDVWWDGNDVNEWGYDNGETEAYRNTENNRKTFSVTYDSEGNLIPLSKRFDETNSDARYSKGEEQRVSNESALDGVSPEQIELRDGLVDIMREAGMDVSVSDAEGQAVLDMARRAMAETDAVREEREIERTNAVFNDELDAFSEDNANRITFSLGRPSEVLRAAGVSDMPMKLYGNKLLKKIKKHGFDKVALRDLPRAVANPIAVFNNYEQEGNRAILTELHTEQGNVLVAIDLGKGADVDFNVVSSAFGKGQNGVVEWINKLQLTYVDKEKALNYLHLAAPIAAASDNQKLSLAANIINGFKNPKLSGENLRQQRKNSITEEMQSIKTKAQSDGTFMLAPNGEPTNLTERQWLQVRTESFKEWFGDWENAPEEASQMKDENGEPKVFYHNTNADFFAFNPLYNGSSTDAGWLGDGFYFYGDPSEGQDYGEKKMSVFLNVREPYYASEEENRSLSEQNDRSASLEFREERESEGYDGVYFNGDLRQETVVFSPTQIKSATDNVGTFDASKEDIREQRVWHGTPHDFDHFDHSKMGTGEGNQAFGWGTYVTQSKGVGYHYADVLGKIHKEDSKKRTPEKIAEEVEWLEQRVLPRWKEEAEEARAEFAEWEEYFAEHEDEILASEQLNVKGIWMWRSELAETIVQARNRIELAEERIARIIAEIDYKEGMLRGEVVPPILGDGNLYEVEIPDDLDEDGDENYAKWDEPAWRISNLRDEWETSDDYLGYMTDYLDPWSEEPLKDVYPEMVRVLGSDKAASQVLSSLGYKGISYPAGYLRGGLKGGEKNYVIFDESDAKIIDKVKLFRGQHGEVRGFAVGGRIYLDPKMASDETAIHEYTHLWSDALRRVNPAEWENVKGLLRGTPIWEETKRLYPELANDEDALADEVLAQFSGKHGAKRLAEAREKAMSEADGVFDKAKVASVFDNVRQALKRFWKGVADFLGLHFTSAEEVADKVLSDLLNGVNPNLINREHINISENEPAKTDNERIAEQLILRLRNAGVDVSVDNEGTDVFYSERKVKRDWVRLRFEEQFESPYLPKDEKGHPLFSLRDALRYRNVKGGIEHAKGMKAFAEGELSDSEANYDAEIIQVFRDEIEKDSRVITSGERTLEFYDRVFGVNALEEYLRHYDEEDKHRVAAEWEAWANKHGVDVNEITKYNAPIDGYAIPSYNNIWVNPRTINGKAVVHEYTHLWAAAIRQANPELWERIKELMPDLPEWREVLSNGIYSPIRNNNDALADEVLAQFSGRHGEAKLLEALQKMKEKDGSPASAHLVQQMFSSVRMALQRFWQAVAKLLGVKYESAEDIADKVLADLLSGVNPRNIDSSAYEAPTIREQRIDNDTREKMQRSVDELRVEVREGYEKAVKDWRYKMQEQWQDSMLALKTLQEQLEKQGVKIEEWENAYWAENRMSSMNEEEMKAYTRDYFKPIVAAQIAASKALPQELTDKLNAMDAHLREFDKMNAEEKQRNAVDNYLMLKHGLERNHVLAMRDAIDAQWENPSEASSVWRAYNEDAGNKENRRLLQEGKRSFEEFLQVDDAIRAHYAGEEYLKNREKDYSGLTSMTAEDKTELDEIESDALQLVKEAEDAAGAELSALWSKVNQATRESVEKLYKSGLLTPAAYSQMTTMFQWYVPLRGFAEETSDEVYDYVDQRNGNGMGAVLKGADGRKSKADSPIAHIGSMAERSVVQGNRNLMKQHFYRMVMAHPNDLVSMGEIYLHHNEVTDEWEMMTPTHSPSATPEQIADETRAFEERMQELVQQEPDKYLRLREHPDVPYRVLGSNLGEHQVLVKVLGRDKLLTVNGDPRVAQAVNGRFNPDAISNDFLKRLRNLNNFLAQMATQRNPEFIFRNLIRDRFYAMEAARVKDGAIDPQYVGRLQKNWISAVGQVVGLTARYNSGTLDMNDAQDRMFYEFMMNGGATGVTRLLNPEEYKGEIADIAKEMQRGKYSPVKLAKLVTKYVDLFGSCSEAITRFATYRTSRELGRSVARSVWDAKEITTNFNKKGAGSKAIRKDDGRWLRMSGETASFFKNFVIFTNANVQGFHNQWQLAKKNPKRFIAHFVAKWVALGFAMPLINNLLAGLFGGDDDHYQDLPETARRNSLCLFVPKVGWVKIPLGFGLRSAYAIGGLLSEQLFYPKGDYTSMTRNLFDIALDLMPLSMGSSEQDWWLNVVPSSLRPLAENIANKDWTGRPIVNENVNENWPEYRRANNRTSDISIKISEVLSDWTGGDEYSPGLVNLNPSQFEHIALGLLSGVGTLAGNAYETTANVIRGEELDTRHIPFVKDFYSKSGGAVHDSAVKRNFYALKDEYEKTKVRVLGYEREEADGKNDPESVARRVDFRKNSAEYKRYEVMDEAVSEVNSLRKDLKEATTPEEVKALEAEMQQVMEDAINDVRAIK